jgi:hypothetical protein
MENSHESYDSKLYNCLHVLADGESENKSTLSSLNYTRISDTWNENTKKKRKEKQTEENSLDRPLENSRNWKF